MSEGIEYGLFNILPEGKTIVDIPQEARWLYKNPFRTGSSKKLLELKAEEINKQRASLMYKMDYRTVHTLCEVRERTITYSDWRKTEEKG